MLGLLGVLGLFTGCSEDREEQGQRVTFEMKPCLPDFTEEQQEPTSLSRTTRTWTPPTGYVTYDALNGKFVQQNDLVNKSIEAFFTQDGQTPTEGTFFYKQGAWQISIEIENTGDYYLYGFIPKEVAATASISGNSSFSEGAVLHLNELKTITPSDVCVTIGAKEGSSADDDAVDEKRLTAGQYKVKILATGSPESPSGAKNYLFLLFDHLYSALRFRFQVGDAYSKLRTIKLTKLELKAYGEDAASTPQSKYDATVTLKATTDGTSPVKEVTFTPSAGSTDVDYMPLFDSKQKEADFVTLTTSTPSDFLGCFVPEQKYKTFTLRSTYNVYDKKGNLIRKGCVAENEINFKDLFKTESSDEVDTRKALRGHMYSLTLTVLPTYLYVLSDPDLDSPTVTVSH
jgi:hypothetical protein